jgi:predicted RNase H-like HicB family nuclease
MAEQSLRHYQVNIFWSEEDGCYVADFPDLKYCSAFGDTPQEALAEALIAEEVWLEVQVEKGRPVPSKE